MKYFTIIAAAGSSNRFKIGDKLLMELDGKRVIDHSLDTFLADENCEKIFVACNPAVKAYLEPKLSTYTKPVQLYDGGHSRSESIWNCIKPNPTGRIVMIHDGARPYVSQTLINRLLGQIQRFEGVIPGLAVTDTIKTLNPYNNVLQTLERRRITAVQTPQVFQHDKLWDAYHLAFKTAPDRLFYDDSQVMEIYGHNCFVKVIEGEQQNIKITYEHDI